MNDEDWEANVINEALSAAKALLNLPADVSQVDFISSVMASAEVVWCVWPDASRTSGYDMLLAKGHQVLAALAFMQQTVDCSMTAMPVADKESAIALWNQYGGA